MADSILLIDADADVLRAVGDYFDGIGYEVGRAGAAGAGLEAFDRLRPDVVILDRHLPDLDGLDVLERLRSQEGAVILLTDQGDIATAARAMQLGAEHFVTKPVDLNHLAAATARVCDKVRLLRQNALLREALDQLLSTARPGNAREMRSVVERAKILARGAAQIGVEHVPADLRKGAGAGGVGGGWGGTAPPAPGARRGGTAAHREDAQVPRRQPHASGPRARDFARDADQ